MNPFRCQVAVLLEAVQLTGPDRFTWFGLTTYAAPKALRRTLPPETLRDVLFHQLQARLYTDFYSRGRAVPSLTEPGAPRRPPRQHMLAAALSAANAGQGFWSVGWCGAETVDGGVIAERGGLRAFVPAESIHPDDSATPGALLRVRHPKELPAISPGFYMALGDIEITPGPMLRLYWHIRQEGAVALMAEVTRTLNGASLPFHFKVLDDPAAFTRCDAAVLYVRQADFRQLVQLLPPILQGVAPHLRSQVPAMTLPLATGLGVAENPGGSASFGQHRCRLLAGALIRAAEAGARTVSDRLDHVERAFAEQGLSLEAPYLNPGSVNHYTAPMVEVAASAQKSSAHLSMSLAGGIAERIGYQLCRRAIWDGDRCTWLGPVAGGAVSRHASVGPDLYQGTAGVGWFLAHLAARTGEAEVRRTALGAIRHALSTAPRSGLAPASLYDGWLGGALSAAQAGRLLADERLMNEALFLVRGDDPPGPDLISGAAGTILGLLALCRITGAVSLQERSVVLGDRLLAAAVRRGSGISWPTPAIRRRRNLTGFAHGAAGIGYALLELAQATGDGRYATGALQAYAYERQWYDPAAGNWPDFRSESPTLGGASLADAHWCHGAGGIALSRWRAYQLTGGAVLRAEATTALTTTYRLTERYLTGGAGNFSICHGLMGNAEILQAGAKLAPSETPELISRILTAAEQTYMQGDRPWVCGGPGGIEAPGLMLGLAGIGYACLRLKQPRWPSILALHPDRFK